MIPYESSGGTTSQTRGHNGSAYEFFGWNPTMQSGALSGNAGAQQGGAQQNLFAQNPYAAASNPYVQQQLHQLQHQLLQQLQQQQQPYIQQQMQHPFAQGMQAGNFGQGFGGQNIGQNFGQGFGTPFAQTGGWPQSFQQFQTPQWAQHGLAQQQQLSPFANAGIQGAVVTTKAVEVEFAVPAHILINRNPQEIQAYLLNVVLPTLYDGLIKRAMAQDIGQSVSVDVRTGFIARLGI